MHQQSSFARKHNRKLLCALLISASFLVAHLLIIPSVFAQSSPAANQTINFSARLKGSSGETAPDGSYNIRFRLYNLRESGSPLWTETHYDTNGLGVGEDHRIKVTGGYLNAKLGSRTPFGDSINWNDNLWLTMEVGGTLQTSIIGNIPWDGEMTPRIELNAVPYAMSAGSLGGRTADDFVQLGQGAQNVSGDNPVIHLNTSGGGNFIQLQKNAEDIFTVSSDGNISFGSGSDHTISIDQSARGEDGRTLAISGGDAGEGDADGGNIVLSGGSGSGSGADGLVILTNATFATATNDANCYTGGSLVSASCVATQSSVDSSSAIMLGFSSDDQTATLPDPTNATPGRILYVMAANDSKAFSLIVNSNESIQMYPKTALTMLWNGSDWVVAGHTGAPIGMPVEPEVVEEAETDNSAITIDDNDESGEVAIDNSNIPEGSQSETESEPTEDGLTGPLQLSQLGGAPAASPGAMYYDTNLGKVQCLEENGWGACGDAPDTFVAISPEYKNAVMNGTDIGIISSDFCSGTLGINDGSDGQPTICNPDETFNFYKWTTEESSDQVRSIYLTYQLPDNFRSFVDGSASIMGRTDSDGAKVSYQIYRDNGGNLISCGSLVTVSSGNQENWQRGLALDDDDPANCDFEAGDSILFRINLTARERANAYVSNVNFIFRNS